MDKDFAYFYIENADKQLMHIGMTDSTYIREQIKAINNKMREQRIYSFPLDIPTGEFESWWTEITGRHHEQIKALMPAITEHRLIPLRAEMDGNVVRLSSDEYTAIQFAYSGRAADLGLTAGLPAKEMKLELINYHEAHNTVYVQRPSAPYEMDKGRYQLGAVLTAVVKGVNTRHKLVFFNFDEFDAAAGENYLLYNLEHYKPGDIVRMYLTGYDNEKRRITLSQTYRFNWKKRYADADLDVKPGETRMVKPYFLNKRTRMVIMNYNDYDGSLRTPPNTDWEKSVEGLVLGEPFECRLISINHGGQLKWEIANTDNAPFKWYPSSERQLKNTVPASVKKPKPKIINYEITALADKDVHLFIVYGVDEAKGQIIGKVNGKNAIMPAETLMLDFKNKFPNLGSMFPGGSVLQCVIEKETDESIHVAFYKWTEKEGETTTPQMHTKVRLVYRHGTAALLQLPNVGLRLQPAYFVTPNYNTYLELQPGQLVTLLRKSPTQFAPQIEVDLLVPEGQDENIIDVRVIDMTSWRAVTVDRNGYFIPISVSKLGGRFSHKNYKDYIPKMSFLDPKVYFKAKIKRSDKSLGIEAELLREEIVYSHNRRGEELIGVVIDTFIIGNKTKYLVECGEQLGIVDENYMAWGMTERLRDDIENRKPMKFRSVGFYKGLQDILRLNHLEYERSPLQKGDVRQGTIIGTEGDLVSIKLCDKDDIRTTVYMKRAETRKIPTLMSNFDSNAVRIGADVQVKVLSLDLREGRIWVRPLESV